jgi:hypothetical protein
MVIAQDDAFGIREQLGFCAIPVLVFEFGSSSANQRAGGFGGIGIALFIVHGLVPGKKPGDVFSGQGG